MRLRKLKDADIPRMLEWMHNQDVVKYFSYDFLNATAESVGRFVVNSQNDDVNLHFAIVDDHDQYMGTVSLKSIDYKNKNAEYAISLHPNAIGLGVASAATDEILRIAFDELKIYKVYLNVNSDNIRAIKFYEKYGFIYEGEFKKHVNIRGKMCDLKWYALFNDVKLGL